MMMGADVWLVMIVGGSDVWLVMMQIIMAFSKIPVTMVMQMLMMMIDDVDGDSDLLKDSSDNHSWVD